MAGAEALLATAEPAAILLPEPALAVAPLPQPNQYPLTANAEPKVELPARAHHSATAVPSKHFSKGHLKRKLTFS